MLQSVEHVTRSFRLMLTNGLWKEVLLQSRQKAFSTSAYVDAVLEIGAFRSADRYPVPLHVRAIGRNEGSFLDAVLSDRTLGSHERHEAARRLNMLATGIRTCYAITDDSGNVRVMQWLIPAGENEAIRRIYGDWYPWLAADEALMENVYVFPRYRGTGVLSSAIRRLVEVARASGVARIVTAIPGTNMNSLMSFVRMGFRPQRVRLERKRFGVSTRTVFPVSSCNDMKSFAQFVAGLATFKGTIPQTIVF